MSEIREMFEGVWNKEDTIYTENMVPGDRVYGENLVDFRGKELREWEPHRSKLGAAVAKGIPELGMDSESSVLYLGAASGTTPSHVSDICRKGMVFGVEHAPRVVRSLLKLSKNRENLAPIYADARKPQEYSDLVGEVDLVFQDIAQPDQVKILTRNCREFLHRDGEALISLKLRAISSSDNLERVRKDAERKIEQEFEILWSSDLKPYYGEDHMFYRLSYT
ncbi:MAG: fibrillarin-like rRNA/tRNA 2'-O-methyltransferase [Candidatus Nanohaloarchaea archaeon]|nr:fibrillarin-like rRNA/tRNA 2'-O-methyltransferase [Candidatus Nanohaloarchaea archaeon]